MKLAETIIIAGDAAVRSLRGKSVHSRPGAAKHVFGRVPGGTASDRMKHSAVPPPAGEDSGAMADCGQPRPAVTIALRGSPGGSHFGLQRLWAAPRVAGGGAAESFNLTEDAPPGTRSATRLRPSGAKAKAAAGSEPARPTTS